MALAILDLHFGLNFGIEFVGGTQIPITLEHPVNVTAMSSLVSALQQRVSTFGLKQTTVEGVGNSEVYVIIPTVSLSRGQPDHRDNTEPGPLRRNSQRARGGQRVRDSQGDHGWSSPPIAGNGTVQWAVSFYISDTAVKQFNKAVLGQGNQPLYMFLDRPTNAIVVINASELKSVSTGLTTSSPMAAMRQALSFGQQTIPIITVSVFEQQPELDRVRSCPGQVQVL